MGFADFFGQLNQVAGVTSAAAAVSSGVFSNTSGSPTLTAISNALGGPQNLSNIAQGAGVLSGGAWNAAAGMRNIGRINGSLLNPANARLAMTGLNQISNALRAGGTLANMIGGAGAGGPAVRFINQNSRLMSGAAGIGQNGIVSMGSAADARSKWAVKIRIPALNGGVVEFPTTPQITITDTAKYSSAGLVHANYAMQFYESSEVSSIQIMGDFPVQNQEQGAKLLQAIYLLRAATKMFWNGDANAGTPPPLVFLNGYGDGYMNDVPCVITSFSHTLPEDKDYILVSSGGNEMDEYSATRVPTLSQIQIQLQPVYSRTLLKGMSVNAISSGKMLNFI